METDSGSHTWWHFFVLTAVILQLSVGSEK